VSQRKRQRIAAIKLGITPTIPWLCGTSLLSDGCARCHDGARSCAGMTLKTGRSGKELPIFSDRSRELKNKNGGSTQLIAGQFPCLEIKNSLF